MRVALMVVLLSGCAMTTSTSLKPGTVLGGPREVTAIGGTPNELMNLEKALTARGFRMRRPQLRPDDVQTAFAVDMSGTCMLRGLDVLLIDSRADDVVMTSSRFGGLMGCPGSLYTDFAAELAQRWRKEPAISSQPQGSR